MSKKKKELREQFRSEVFERDNYTCCVCGKVRPADRLDAHHIMDRSHFPNGGYVPENGITVCIGSCHLQVEEFHIYKGQVWVKGFHPFELYEKIDSSLRQAIIADSKITT